MANVINYATTFERELKQKYTREALSSGLTTERIQFVNANTIKIPYVIVGGYKDHGRQGGFNRQSVENKWMTKTLAFDRNIEFFVDSMDVDESNEVVAAANITNTFVTEQAIPEMDVYRFSKLYADFVDLGGVVDTTALTASNILDVFDNWMEQMTDKEVPVDGRILYVTPSVNKLLKTADAVQRQINVSSAGGLDRRIVSLDNVNIVEVPSGRLKTSYDFTDGFKPAADAKQINMILVHPSSVIACDKHSYIRLWAPGTHTQGDGYLYQNRKYGDLFVLDTRKDGIAINTDAE
ncbi:MAG TPA: capsid protein [Clostridia bacterium]|jgi:hypothetical protein|nr:capsid protein [Clostridia bacterium]